MTAFKLESPIRFFEYDFDGDAVFSILIPSWNNHEHLKLLIESIRKNSTYKHQVCVHLNEGKDQSKALLEELKISHSISKENAGVCFGFNAASALAKGKYIVLIDDDKYVAPQWDEFLMNEIKKRNSMYWSISGTMIERHHTGNSCVISPYNYGSNATDFNEELFLKEVKDIPHKNWSGSLWYPLVLDKKLWNLVGGLSNEFSPGMYSDPDFMMKLWQAGVRDFMGVAESRSYHFMSKSTRRVKRNNGRLQFFRKWGISSSTFIKFYIHLGGRYNGPLHEPSGRRYKKAEIKDKIKGWLHW
jgi:glycosyltransferase involved in cell wall biosynthesis